MGLKILGFHGFTLVVSEIQSFKVSEFLDFVFHDFMVSGFQSLRDLWFLGFKI